MESSITPQNLLTQTIRAKREGKSVRNLFLVRSLRNRFQALWLQTTCTHVCTLPRELRDVIYKHIVGGIGPIWTINQEDDRSRRIAERLISLNAHEPNRNPKVDDLLQPSKVGSTFAHELGKTWCKRYIELSTPMIGFEAFLHSDLSFLGKSLAEYIQRLTCHIDMMSLLQAGYGTSASDEGYISRGHISGLHNDLESLLLLKSSTHIEVIINCQSDDDKCLTCHADHFYREIASRSMFHWNPLRRIDLLDHLGPICKILQRLEEAKLLVTLDITCFNSDDGEDDLVVTAYVQGADEEFTLEAVNAGLRKRETVSD